MRKQQKIQPGDRIEQGAPDSLASLAQEVGRCETAAPPVNQLAQDPELVQEFLMEAREHLSHIEGLMIEIESGASNAEAVNGVFRSFHTIKGLAGFLDYEVIQSVAHEVETLLDKARTGALMLTPARVEAVLRAGDYIGSWLRYIEDPATGAPADHLSLVARVQSAMDETGESSGLDSATPEQTPPQEEKTAETVVERVAEGGARVEVAAVKVATGKLGDRGGMVGELVIAQSMLKHNPDLVSVRTPRLLRDVAQLGRVTAEVQKTAMAMRMVPVGQLFRKMNRLVRDLARKSGKKAELEMIGEDVELDRTLVEELADPLVHMIRNSMDHGLESPAERKAAGKPAAGKIRLRASHQAGQIVIEVADDGRGLDRRRILEKAMSRGLVAPTASPSDQEIFHMIFQPGFSTAEKVTDVSGRGVGMDVVRKQVEKLRGRIDIESRSGRGSVFLLKLPLTLAIIEGLVVTAGGERYIVPIFAVREMFKPAPEKIFTVEGRGEMALVRDRLVPVSRLARKLGLPETGKDATDGLMIVGESEGREFCLLVDEMVGKQEVVIKTLGPAFSHVRGISGGAILGDGRVGLILDVGVLLHAGGARAA